MKRSYLLAVIVALALIAGGCVVPVENPSPSSSSPSSSSLVIRSPSSFVSSTDITHVVGAVQNQTKRRVGGVELTETYYDASGQIVGTGTTYIQPKRDQQILGPNEIASFDFVCSQEFSWDHYALKVRPWAFAEKTTSPSLPVVLAATSYGVSGITHIIGVVQNQMAEWVPSVSIIAAFYDASGKTVGTAFTQIQSKMELQPGEVPLIEPDEVVPFELILSQKIPWDHYSLGLEWVMGIFTTLENLSPSSDSPSSPSLLSPSEGTSTTSPLEGVVIVSENDYVVAIDDCDQPPITISFGIRGVVKNQTAGRVGLVKIIAIFYDAGGQALGTIFTYIQPTGKLQTLQPGETASFDLNWSQIIPRDHYSLKVEYAVLTIDTP